MQVKNPLNLGKDFARAVLYSLIDWQKNTHVMKISSLETNDFLPTLEFFQFT